MPKVKLPRQWKWGSVPEEVLESNLSIFAKMAIAAITFHAFDDGPAWPGTDRLARLCSCSKRAVLRAIPELEKAGFLKVDRTKGKVNEYQFLSKTSAQQSPVTESPVPDSHQTSAPQSPDSSKLVPDSHPNKTLKTNETKKRISPQGEFVDWFKIEYQKQFGKPYVESKADYIKVAELLRIFQVETLKAMVPGAWAHKDPWIQKVSMSVKGFCSSINQLSTAKPVKIQSGGPQDIGYLARSRAERAREEKEAMERKAQ